jgi:Ca-activated chloride channel family protein
MPEQFHFLYPQWLLLLVPLAVWIGLLQYRKQRDTAWRKVIEPQLLEQLLTGKQTGQSIWPSLLLGLGGILAIVALANPVWQKIPQAVFQTPQSLVVVLDLSASMNATDLKPSRLVRARLKLQDILKREREGQIGLVVFAGDAFSVTPLTRDNETIRSQLRVLEPDIMPAQGSRMDLGLQQAADLLQQASISAGDILVIGDGYESALTTMKIKALHEQGQRISILGVGTPTGAPISDGRGGVLLDEQDKPVLARLEEDKLRKLAELGGGRYSRIRTDDGDIDYLLSQAALQTTNGKSQTAVEQQRWRENGPLLSVLLLPLAALAFRRGWLFSLLLFGIYLPPQPAYAFGWQDLWQTREQQAAQALQQQRLQDAASLSSDPRLIGSALYKQQQYQQAAEQFAKDDSADAWYNHGNTLAHLGQYEEAIKSYEQALQQQPDMQDAITNKKIIEDLLRQQQEQEQQQEQQSQQQNQQQDQQSESGQQDKQQDARQQQAESQQTKQQQDKQQSPQQSNADQSAEPQQNSSGQDNKNQADQSDNQFDNANQQLGQQQQADGQPQTDSELQDAASDSHQQQNQQAAAQQNQSQTENATDKNVASAEQQVQPLASEEQMAAEQWLRRIPDDPGSLLKRKFLYQYQQRPNRSRSRQPW